MTIESEMTKFRHLDPPQKNQAQGNQIKLNDLIAQRIQFFRRINVAAQKIFLLFYCI